MFSGFDQRLQQHSAPDGKLIVTMERKRLQQPRRALILAAGIGSRLRPLTDHVPKCLVPIAGRPLLAYWIDALTRVGVRDIWINSHAHADQVRKFIARCNSRDCGVRVHECHEPVLLGSAGTVAANPTIADGAREVVVVYADNFSMLDLRCMLEAHAARRAEFTMALFEAPNPSACGIAELDTADRIVAFAEKPEAPASNLANAGIYLVSSAVYREIADLRAFDFGFDVIRRFVGRMHGFRLAGYHIDIGTPEAYTQACARGERLLAAYGQTPDARRRAVFLGRDGTLLERVSQLAGAESIRLTPECGRALRALRDAGFALIVTEEHATAEADAPSKCSASRIRARMFDLLEAEDVAVDAVYERAGPGVPARAAAELGLALERSYQVADAQSGFTAEDDAVFGASLLIGPGAEAQVRESRARRAASVPGLGAAAEWILANAATTVGRSTAEATTT